jgi:hypothetical protein
MQPKQPQKTIEKRQLVLERFFQSNTEAILYNIDKQDEAALEQTIKFCELIISLNVGILGAISLSVFLSQDLFYISKVFLVLMVALILYSIIESFLLRDNILETNRSIAEERANLGEANAVKVYDSIEELLSVSDADFFEKINSNKKIENEDLEKINRKLRGKEPDFFRRKNLLRFILFGLIVMLFVVIVIQSNIFSFNSSCPIVL